MRTAFVTTSVSRNAGGLYDACRRLAQEEQAAGDEVEVFGVADDHTEQDQTGWRPVPVHACAPAGPRQLGYAPALPGRLKHFHPDVVHTHGLWTLSSLAAVHWQTSTGKPLVIHPHGMMDPWAMQSARWKKWLALLLYERRHWRQASCFRALCSSERDSIRALGLTNPVAIIPNGVDLPEMPAEERKSETNKRLLLFLGRLHPKKGLVPLLEGWARFREGDSTAKEWVLGIAGWDQGGHEAELQKQATRLGLGWKTQRAPALPSVHDAESVHFLGPRFEKDKEVLLRGCEAFILPSFSEGLPMSVLEAWAYAKPVLMTAACNLPEGFAAGAAWPLSPAPDSIADALTTLARRSDVECHAAGAKARALVERQFTWPKVASQLREVMEWLVHGGPVPSTVER